MFLSVLELIRCLPPISGRRYGRGHYSVCQERGHEEEERSQAGGHGSPDAEPGREDRPHPVQAEVEKKKQKLRKNTRNNYN